MAAFMKIIGAGTTTPKTAMQPTGEMLIRGKGIRYNVNHLIQSANKSFPNHPGWVSIMLDGLVKHYCIEKYAVVSANDTICTVLNSW